MIANKVRAAWEMCKREEFVEAWPVCKEILNEEPDNAEALYLVGSMLRKQGHVGHALQLFRRALAIKRDIPNLWMHYGACLHDTNQYDEARACFAIVQKALPNDPMPLANTAASYVQEGKAREAVEWADKALAIDPEHTIAKIAKAFGCLALGRWKDGWDHIEALYSEKLITRVYTPEKEPIWDGSKGKTVVVQADQGLGDMIMFSQCLTDMVKDCKKVILDTNDRIAPVFKRNFPEIDVYPTLKSRGLEWPKKYQIDATIHLSWLGKYYRKSSSEFPRKAYLTADPELAKVYREWLEQFPKPWVGIAWRGGIPETNTKARSMVLADLAPVIQSGGTPISLAYQDVGLEVSRWNIDHDAQVVVPSINNNGSYEHTLALISQLDHVVTVTTTAAHACGALGKSCSVLVNRVPQWRYAHGKDHLLWYPESLTLYRQLPGETTWEPAVTRLMKDLNAKLGKNLRLPEAQDAA